MIDLSTYVFETLGEEGELVLYRGRSQDDGSRLLAVEPGSERPSVRSLEQLEHEYSIREELDGDWVAQPIVELLASQAAISLDHARVYAELAVENSERNRAEEELRRSESFLAQRQRISHTGSWWLAGCDRRNLLVGGAFPNF